MSHTLGFYKIATKKGPIHKILIKASRKLSYNLIKIEMTKCWVFNVHATILMLQMMFFQNFPATKNAINLLRKPKLVKIWISDQIKHS